VSSSAAAVWSLTILSASLFARSIVNTAPLDFDAAFGVSVPKLFCRGVEVPDLEAAGVADPEASLTGGDFTSAFTAGFS
jgi:hypothetical protein